MLVAAVALLAAVSGASAQTQPEAYAGDLKVTLLGGWSGHRAVTANGVREISNDGFNAGGRLEYGLPGRGLSDFSVAIDMYSNQVGFGAAAAGTDLNTSSLMADLLYHLPTGSPFGFYAGAGAGAVHDNLDGVLHGASTVLGWQVLGGVQYALSQHTNLIAEYRYQNAPSTSIGGAGMVGNVSHGVSFGVKFSL